MRRAAWRCSEVSSIPITDAADLSSEVVDVHCFDAITEQENFDTVYTFMKWFTEVSV